MNNFNIPIKVSIIIPAYNAELYIQEAIESVLSQTFKDIELIVVDDSSIDRTAEIVKGFGSKLKYLRHSENKGLSSARNSGFRQAQGEYIAFLDADDVWLPTKTEEQVKLLENDKELALVYSNCYLINEEGLHIGKLFDSIKPYSGFVFRKLILDNFIPTSSVIIRKKILDELGGFNERLVVSQDFDLLLRIAEHYKIDFTNFPLLKYRVHPNSLGTIHRRLMFEEAISITKFYKDKIGTMDKRLILRLNKAIAKYLFYIAIWSLSNINKREAIDWYIKCLNTKAFDFKIILAFLFFVLPRNISIPLMRNLIKIRDI